MGMNGICALCDKHAELKLSHIIPKFVFSWFKESSPSAIRAMHSPNLRIQDGIKMHLLCSNCENLLSGWEKTFCESVFATLHDNPNITTPIRYGAWFLKFATSVSFRVLTYFHRSNYLLHFSEKQRETAQIASDVWRDFILGNLPNPGQFEQHFLPVDAIQSCSGSSISPYLNRYFLRSVHMDVPCSNTSAMVYTKMGHLILFGFIQNKSSERWKGTKIHVNKGQIMPRIYRIPKNIANYWNDKADEASKALDSISPKQKHIINQSVLNNADKLIDSEVFRAIQYDVYHSGRNAFRITDSDDTDNIKTNS